MFQMISSNMQSNRSTHLGSSQKAMTTLWLVAMTKYYAGSQRIAVRVGNTASGTTALTWLLSDHLGSTTKVIRALDYATISETRYKPFGQPRYVNGVSPTQRGYTGQVDEPDLGLTFFQSRFYDSSLGHFISPDSIIPGAGNPLAWDRYAFVFNNPINLVDPSGHRPCSDEPNFSECEKGLPHAVKSKQVDTVPVDPINSNKYWEIRSLYYIYKNTKGWWNEDGYGSAYFTELDFLRLILSYELSPISKSEDPGKLEMLAHGTAHWFYGRCETISKGTCPGITPNAIFNFLVGSQSVGGKIIASKAGLLGNVTLLSEANMSVANLVVNGIVNPKSEEWTNGGSGLAPNTIPRDHPVWWGNKSKLLSTYGFIPTNPLWIIPGADPWYLLPAVPEKP